MVNTASDKFIAIIHKYYIAILISAIILGVVFLIVLLPVYRMSAVWSVPYFSGAANTSWGGEWLFAPEEVPNFKAVEGFDIYFYEFQSYPTAELATYSYNITAYLYLVKIAHLLFPFLGQVGSVVLLQLLVHIGIVAMVMSRIPGAPYKMLFVLLYAINPVILYITLMPFYYFWSVLGSLGALLILISPKSDRIKIITYTGLIIIGFLTRATVLPLIVFVVFVLLYHRQFISASIAILLVFGSVFLYNTYLNQTIGYGPWHTAFVGIGGYPNQYPYLNDLSDDRGVERYEDLSGIELSTSIDGNFYKREIRSHYAEVMQSEYMQIVKENPFLILRNLVLNTLQIYSVGHLANRSIILNLLISISGLAVLTFLAIYRAFGYILLIFFTGFGVAMLYPPIPAYNYATYLVLVFAVISTLHHKTLTPKKILV